MSRLSAALFFWGLNTALLGFVLGVWVERGWLIWWAFVLQLAILPLAYVAASRMARGGA